jgi:beta-lactamase regulating signal transducer with metallopeptidase domain
MLRILGWIIVVWLFGSIIYSTQFHLRNYFISRGRESLTAKDLEAPGQEIEIKRNEFLRRVLGLQFIKIALMLFLIYMLLNKQL